MESCSLFTEKLGQIQTQVVELKTAIDRLIATGKEDAAISVTRLSKQLQQTQNSFIEEYQEQVRELLLLWYGPNADSKVLKRIQFTSTGRVDYIDANSLNLSGSGNEYLPFLFRNIKHLVVPATLRSLSSVEEIEVLHIAPVETESVVAGGSNNEYSLSALELRKITSKLSCSAAMARLSFSKLKECPVFTADKVQTVDLSSFEKGSLTIRGGNLADLSLPLFTNGSLRTNAGKVNVPILAAAKTIELSGNGEFANFPQLQEVENILSIQSMGTVHIPHFEKGDLTIEHANELDMSEVTEHTGDLHLYDIRQFSAAKLEKLNGYLDLTGLPSSLLSQVLPALKSIDKRKQEDKLVLRADQWQQLELLIREDGIDVNTNPVIAEPFPGTSYDQVLPFLHRSIQELQDQSGHEIIFTGGMGNHILLNAEILKDVHGNAIPMADSAIANINREWSNDSGKDMTFFDRTNPSSKLQSTPIYFYAVPPAFSPQCRQVYMHQKDFSMSLYPSHVDQNYIAYTTIENNTYAVLKPEFAFLLPFLEPGDIDEATAELIDKLVHKYAFDIDQLAEFLLNTHHLTVGTHDKLGDWKDTRRYDGIKKLLSQLHQNLEQKAIDYLDNPEWVKKLKLPDLVSLLQYIYISPLSKDTNKEKISEIIQLPIQAGLTENEMFRLLSETIQLTTNERMDGTLVEQLIYLFPNDPEVVAKLTYAVINKICERSKAINDPTSPLFQSDTIFGWMYILNSLLIPGYTVEAIESRIEKIFACKSLEEAKRLL